LQTVETFRHGREQRHFRFRAEALRESNIFLRQSGHDRLVGGREFLEVSRECAHSPGETGQGLFASLVAL